MKEIEDEHLPVGINLSHRDKYKKKRPEPRRPIRRSKNDEGKQDYPSSEVSEDEELSCDESEPKLPSNADSDWPFSFGFRDTAVLLFSILVVVVVCGYANNKPTPLDWRNEINKMFLKFPNQPENYKFDLRNGIQRIFDNPSKPSTFLFVHNENEGKTSKLLAYEYASIAVDAMGTQSPACLTYEKLKNLPNFENDYGWVIDHYKPEIERRGVLIVLGLEKLPGNLAQAFHFLCDEFTPAVDKSIYIFTLNYNSTLSRNPTSVVEEILRNNWKEFLNEDLIEPLITRITNSILVIRRENQEINNAHKFCD